MKSLEQGTKKEYLISLLKKYGEYDEGVDRENIDNETVNRMSKVLVTKDEGKRGELINSYIEEEKKEMKERRKKAEELLAKTKKLLIQVKEAKANLKDKKDIEDLEEQIYSS